MLVYITQGFWIGATDVRTEGTFEWMDGTGNIDDIQIGQLMNQIIMVQLQMEMKIVSNSDQIVC